MVEACTSNPDIFSFFSFLFLLCFTTLVIAVYFTTLVIAVYF